MSATLVSLGIDQLPRAEQWTLFRELGESLASSDAGGPISPDQLAELRRRIAADDAEPEDGVPWDEIKERMNRRWGWT